jgi:hypothetical protein
VLERRRDAGRKDQDARHLQQRQQPVWDVIGVVGGGEPGEVHPRPPQAEEDHGIARHGVAGLACHQCPSQLDTCPCHRYHECQVKEQLKRRGRTMFLAWVAARRWPDPQQRA